MPSSSFSPDQQPSQETTKVLVDEKSRSLQCSVEQSFTLKGVEYYLLKPVDHPVSIIVLNEEQDEDEPIFVEDEAEIDILFPKAEASLAELNLTLKRNSFALTVAGELPELEEELFPPEEEAEEDLEVEEFQLLTTFWHDEVEYGIYTPLTPLLFLAKATPQGDLDIISLEEYENIEPILQEWI